jgi:glycosyltransferase involved in cell wall biosynthesis
MSEKYPLSVLILTKDEEVNLPGCLESFNWADDIVVFDSFSEDSTCEIAKGFGASVVKRKFDNWSTHQNWAVENINFKNKWVYYSDADERVTPEMKQELIEIINKKNDPNVAYRLRYKNMFMGTWNKRSFFYPLWILRLFQPSKVRWERLVNPVAVVDGPEGRMESHFEHYSFNKGMFEWFKKHNAYSSHEAEELVENLTKPVHWKGLLSNNITRRKTIKEIAYRLPGRPLMMFIYLYVVRMGFLEGRCGFHFSLLRAYYEYMIDIKVIELKRRKKGLTI